MKTVPKTATTGIRFTTDDRKLVAMLSKKLGVGQSQILRLGLRALAQKEGLTA